MTTVQTIKNLQTRDFQTKFKAGGYYISVRITVEKGRMLFHFGYNKDLLEEVKSSFENRKYHGYISGDERKLWSAPITQRNLFQFEVLQGKYCPIDPYSNWTGFVDHTDKILNHCEKRQIKLYDHQVEMINQGLNSHWFLWAAEMGTGKTLAAIILMEMCGVYDFGNVIWVGPKSALIAARAEFRKWRTTIDPAFHTYEGLRRVVKEWIPDNPAPKILFCDESSKCKTPTTLRSLAAKTIADAMRQEHGWPQTYIGLLSGTPAPKSPSDWWMQCEIACPGFLREQNIFLFRQRLGHVIKEERAPGEGAYNKLHTWKDTDDKCLYCGEIDEHINHEESQSFAGNQSFEKHKFIPGINEVAKLKKRMTGLVGVWLKKDCLDLPDKRYETVELEPSTEILNAAKSIIANSTRAVDALIRLRTLSDGFLYETVGTGHYSTCKDCNGTGKVTEYFDRADEHAGLLDEEIDGSFRYQYSEYTEDDQGHPEIPEVVGRINIKLGERKIACYNCAGKKEMEIEERNTIIVSCPKIDLLVMLLEQHEEIGRLNIYAGFTGSIDRIEETCRKQTWTTLRADGRGWVTTHPTEGRLDWAAEEAVYNYQEKQDVYTKMCFIGQPGAAGMGLTLTASPTTFFYSNDFNPESRQQAEDRGHRIGMDIERGGRIVDCVHLPSDIKVIESLKKSKKLQLLSMKGLEAYYE